MGAQVLGRVTAPLDGPRGPAGSYKITVPPEWLAEGATVEFELPRNLSCTACDGGGCGECDYSGAITVRGRKELSEFVQVILPVTDLTGTLSGGVVIRIPEHGGFASDPDVPRGHLMLAVRAGKLMEGVQLVEDEAPLVETADESTPTSSSAKPPVWLKVVALVVVLYVIMLISLRILGLG